MSSNQILPLPESLPTTINLISPSIKTFNAVKRIQLYIVCITFLGIACLGASYGFIKTDNTSVPNFIQDLELNSSITNQKLKNLFLVACSISGILLLDLLLDMSDLLNFRCSTNYVKRKVLNVINEWYIRLMILLVIGIPSLTFTIHYNENNNNNDNNNNVKVFCLAYLMKSLTEIILINTQVFILLETFGEKKYESTRRFIFTIIFTFGSLLNYFSSLNFVFIESPQPKAVKLVSLFIQVIPALIIQLICYNKFRIIYSTYVTENHIPLKKIIFLVYNIILFPLWPICYSQEYKFYDFHDTNLNGIFCYYCYLLIMVIVFTMSRHSALAIL